MVHCRTESHLRLVRPRSFLLVLPWPAPTLLSRTRTRSFILNFLTQYILFSFMIPMSLYVTIELVKVGQAKFMEWDARMSWADPDHAATGDPAETKWMKVKNSSICEELGNIDYIFSDKTGTLTSETGRDAVARGGVDPRGADVVLWLLQLCSRRHPRSCLF